MELRFLLCLCCYFCSTVVLAKISYRTNPAPGKYRSSTYTPEIISKMCLLKPDTGPCRANIRMYHYDPDIGNCTRFYWGGCQGNGNRFDSRSECLSTCLTQPNMPSQYRPRYCQLSFDYGFCFGALNRWYYDRIGKVCKKTIYSGCGGNKNNFYRFEQCDNICRLGHPPSTLSTKGAQRDRIIVNPENATTKATVIKKMQAYYTAGTPDKKRIMIPYT